MQTRCKPNESTERRHDRKETRPLQNPKRASGWPKSEHTILDNGCDQDQQEERAATRRQLP